MAVARRHRRRAGGRRRRHLLGQPRPQRRRRIVAGNGAGAASTPVNDGTWYQVTHTRNATTGLLPGSGASAYSVFADLNADGQINALDLGIAKARLNTRLPAGEPVATALLFGTTAISALS